jgi:5-bromo-4-chloroindolyl phosphate hydrolysis protein
VSDRHLRETLEEGAARLQELEKYAQMIGDRSIRGKVDAIRDVAAKIYENFRKDPKDIKAARQFLSYHFDAAVKIIRRYVDLSSRSSNSADIAATLKKVESLLDVIRKAFEKQLDILLRDDVLDLETEIKLMENTIRMEGLGE